MMMLVELVMMLVELRMLILSMVMTQQLIMTRFQGKEVVILMMILIEVVCSSRLVIGLTLLMILLVLVVMTVHLGMVVVVILSQHPYASQILLFLQRITKVNQSVIFFGFGKEVLRKWPFLVLSL